MHTVRVALVLDTETLPGPKRAEAVRAPMRYARVPAQLTHETDDRVHVRVEVCDAALTVIRRFA